MKINNDGISFKIVSYFIRSQLLAYKINERNNGQQWANERDRRS